MRKSTLGKEQELLLLDTDTLKVKNVALEIFYQIKNAIASGERRINGEWSKYAPFEGKFGIGEETNTAVIEIISNTTDSIPNLHQDLVQKGRALEEICKEYNAIPIATSEFGHGAGKVIPKKAWKGIGIYEVLIGLDTYRKMVSAAGGHTHILQPNGVEKRFKLYRLLRSLDVAFTFASSSPISHLGKHEVNCHRLNLVRNQMPLDPRGYILDSKIEDYRPIETFENRGRETNKRWKKICVERGISPKDFDPTFLIDGTGFPSERARIKYPTIEIRGPDANTLPVDLAMATFYRGARDRLEQENPHQTISNKKYDWKYSGQQMILPNFATIKEHEQIGIRNGLNSHSGLIKEFLWEAIEYSESGLTAEEKPYLQPLKDMLITGKNLSTQAIEYIDVVKEEQLSPEKLEKTARFFREKYVQGLNYKQPEKQNISYQKHLTHK